MSTAVAMDVVKNTAPAVPSAQQPPAPQAAASAVAVDNKTHSASAVLAQQKQKKATDAKAIDDWSFAWDDAQPTTAVMMPPHFPKVAAVLTRSDLERYIRQEYVAICNRPFRYIVPRAIEAKAYHPTMMSFQSNGVPSISIGDYFDRLARYLPVSSEAMLLSFVHVAGINMNIPSFWCNPLTMHRLVLASMLVLYKYFDDHADGWSMNAHFAAVGGIPNKEMNSLEVSFLELVECRLYVSPEYYNELLSGLVSHKQKEAQKEAADRAAAASAADERKKKGEKLLNEGVNGS